GGQQDLAQANFTGGDLCAESSGGYIDVEQGAEQGRHRVNLVENCVTQVQIAHGAEIAHCHCAGSIERRIKARKPCQKAGNCLAIGRVQMENLPGILWLEPEQLEGVLGAPAQIDGETHAEAEQMLEVGVAQMLNRIGQIASRKVFQAEIQVVMGSCDRF